MRSNVMMGSADSGNITLSAVPGVGATLNLYLPVDCVDRNYAVSCFIQAGVERIVGSTTYSSGSDAVWVTINPYVPATPASLNVPNPLLVGTNTISWGSVANATSYDLECQVDSGSWSALAYPSATSATHSIPSSYSTVAYRVRTYFYAAQTYSGYRTSATINVAGAVSISGSNTNLGTLTASFPSQTYTVSDTKGGTVSITEKIGSTTIRTYTVSLSAGGTSATQTLTVPAATWGALANAASSATITVTNPGNQSVTRTYSFTKSYPAPTISGSDTNLGNLDASFPNQTYTVTDSIGGTVTVVEKIGSTQIRSYNLTLTANVASATQTLTVTAATWSALPSTSNTATITVTNAGNSTVRTFTFIKISFPNIEVGLVIDVDYTGAARSITLPQGDYIFECWGAQGGADESYQGSNGGYTKGKLRLAAERVFHLFVGGKGKSDAAGSGTGGWNGGGDAGATPSSGAGGGASDIRLVSGEWDYINGLRSRIMVAAGAGGAGNAAGRVNLDGYGGGLEGGKGNSGNTAAGTQTSGYAFGKGGTSTIDGGGGGSGYYGGLHPGADRYASGGSSFISGHPSCNAVASETSGTHTGQPNHYSGLVFTHTVMISGNASMPNPRGTGDITGNSGDGFIRLTVTRLGPPPTDLDVSRNILLRGVAFSPVEDINPNIPVQSTRWVSDMEYVIAQNRGKTTSPTGTTVNITGSSYAGGVLAPNGSIYFIPSGSASVGWFNPVGGTSGTFGSLGTSGEKWYSGVLANNGMIYGVPRNATGVLKINPADHSVTTFGNISGTNKWVGAALAPNGKIYCVPLSRNDVLVIDPKDDTTYIIPNAIPGTTTNSYESCVILPNGKIYAIPYHASYVLVIDTNNDATYTFGSLGTAATKWCGGVLAPNGKIYCVPMNANNVLVIDPKDDTTYTISGSQTGTTRYYGAVLGYDGKVYGIKYSATVGLAVDPVTDTVSSFGSLGSTAYLSGVLHPNGKIYNCANNTASCLVYDLGADLTIPTLSTLTSAWYNHSH